MSDLDNNKDKKKNPDQSEKMGKIIEDVQIINFHNDLMDMGRKFRHLLKNRYKEFGLPNNQIRIIHKLEKDAEPPISNLSERIHIKKSNMTSVIDKLCDLGYIERFRDEFDRRIVRIKLTKKGKNLKSELIKRENELILDLYRNIPPKRIREYFDVLSALKKDLEDNF